MREICHYVTEASFFLPSLHMARKKGSEPEDSYRVSEIPSESLSPGPADAIDVDRLSDPGYEFMETENLTLSSPRNETFSGNQDSMHIFQGHSDDYRSDTTTARLKPPPQQKVTITLPPKKAKKTAKRGRGRPRKAEAIVPIENDTESDEEDPKSRRKRVKRASKKRRQRARSVSESDKDEDSGEDTAEEHIRVKKAPKTVVADSKLLYRITYDFTYPV